MTTSLKCACLVTLNQTGLLMVRVRDNQHWYLPGGKIESGESAEQALIRESLEELSIHIIPDSIKYLTTTIGPAYQQEGLVELLCFSAQWKNQISPCAEISEAAFLGITQRDLFAPVVSQFCDEWLIPQNIKYFN
jgi:8-oxo-dGTP diphosphatase